MEVWIWNAVAYAASQFSDDLADRAAAAPRSTWSHCGSLNALDQRVPVLPSTAAAAGVPAFSVEEAVPGCPAQRWWCRRPAGVPSVAEDLELPQRVAVRRWPARCRSSGRSGRSR